MARSALGPQIAPHLRQPACTPPLPLTECLDANPAASCNQLNDADGAPTSWYRCATSGVVYRITQSSNPDNGSPIFGACKYEPKAGSQDAACSSDSDECTWVGGRTQRVGLHCLRTEGCGGGCM